jgi:hypothetical protein
MSSVGLMASIVGKTCEREIGDFYGGKHGLHRVPFQYDRESEDQNVRL